MTLRAKLWRAFWRFASRAWHGRIIRVPILLALHRVGRLCSGEESPLAPLRHDLDLEPEHVRNPEVRRLLESGKLTAYGMDVDVINFLCEFLETNRVTAILEFGSGISTVVLAGLQAAHGAGSNQPDLPCVISIEESEEYADRTRRILINNGLAKVAAVIHCPLAVRTGEGRAVSCYSFDHHLIGSRFPGWQPELVLVDGPSTGGLSRAMAVSEAVRVFPGIRHVLMDDALRVHELACIRFLERARLVRFKGVVFKGKGLALGVRD
ncbi:MAG: hypothetical protein N2255_08615 [Kiritimatiellae bacterium]|nr:hypothetical protein [Kiritimatiellia bacterium]